MEIPRLLRNRFLLVGAGFFLATPLVVTLLPAVGFHEFFVPSSSTALKGSPISTADNTTAIPITASPTTLSHTTDSPSTLSPSTASPTTTAAEIPQCVTQRDDDGTFYLSGMWTENATLAASLEQQHAGTCKPGQEIYPYGSGGGHGCCTSKPKARKIVFCPELYTTATDAYDTPIYSPRKAIDSFMESIRGRHILFLGDSITLQVFAAIAMELGANQILFQWKQHNPAIFSITLPETTGTNTTATATTLKLIYFYRLENVNRTGLKMDQKPAPGPMHIQDKALIPAIQEADIVIANVGLHHWPLPEYHYRQLKHIQDIIETENQARQNIPQQQPSKSTSGTIPAKKKQDICLIWRRTTPQHFATRNGSGQYGDRVANYTSFGCIKVPLPWKHPSDQAFERLRKTTLSPQNTTITPVMMDYTSILEGAYEFHSLNNNNADCSHFCYSPLIWSPILHLTEQTIRQACKSN